MESTVLSISTGSESRVVDLTGDVERFLRDVGAEVGLVNVFLPHATAGLAIIETGAGSDADLIGAVDQILPRDDRWRHRHGSPGHGADHVLPAIISPSVSVPVLAGAMTLGTWQSVVLVDTNVDNPQRTVRLSFMEG